jgi:hypothetical protein
MSEPETQTEKAKGAGKMLEQKDESAGAAKLSGPTYLLAPVAIPCWEMRGKSSVIASHLT